MMKLKTTVDGEDRASQFYDDDSSDSVLKSAVGESLKIVLLCIKKNIHSCNKA
jgi:hypothetical protein